MVVFLSDKTTLKKGTQIDDMLLSYDIEVPSHMGAFQNNPATLMWADQNKTWRSGLPKKVGSICACREDRILFNPKVARV